MKRHNRLNQERTVERADLWTQSRTRNPLTSWTLWGTTARLAVIAIAMWMLAACTQNAPSHNSENASREPEAASAVAPVRYGVLDRVSGVGRVQMCGDTCADVRDGAEISVGNSLVTDAMSRAALTLVDGSSLAIDADSRLRVSQDKALVFEQGQLVMESKTATTLRTPAGDVLLDPSSSVSVRATTSTRDPSVFRTRVSVLNGSISLKTGARTQTLAAGQSAIAERDDVRIQPGSNLAYQTSWARGLRVEAEVDDENDLKAPEGIGNILGKDPATKRELPEAIEIRKLAVHTTIRERVARTEIEQVFENTTQRTLEGLYTFPLPEDASIVRFAMEINGEMMEGELLPKKRATQIFDQVVAEYMRPKDPALLEWKGGNTFQIRIFPIFPKKPQRIVLWYTQTLAADGTESRYTYPLPRTGKVDVDRFEFTADIAARSPLRFAKTPMYASSVDLQNGTASVRFEKENFSPRNDLVLEWEEENFASSVTYTGTMKEGEDPYFMMVLRPSLDAMTRAAPPKPNPTAQGRDVVFVVDTSFGTTSGDLKAATAAVAAFIAELGPDDRFAVLAANQTAQMWSFGLSSVTDERARKAIAFLEQHTPQGASHLEGMFTHAAKALQGSKHPTVVYIGDGRATLGETRAEQLIDSVEASFGRQRATVHAIGIGSETNASLLTRLTRRMGGVFEPLNRGERVPTRIALMAQKTRRANLRQAMLAFSSDKIDFVYPTHLPTLQQGEEFVVVGRFRGEVDAQVTLTGLVGDQPFAQPFRVRLSEQEALQRSFIPRLWAQKHIHNKTLFGGPEHIQDIVNTSIRYTVMSRFTSFLVLESERMYKRFRVERNRDRAYWDATGDKAEEKTTGAEISGQTGETERASRSQGDEAQEEEEDAKDDADALFKKPTDNTVTAQKEVLKPDTNADSFNKDQSKRPAQPRADALNEQNTDRPTSSPRSREVFPSEDPAPSAEPEASKSLRAADRKTNSSGPRLAPNAATGAAPLGGASNAAIDDLLNDSGGGGKSGGARGSIPPGTPTTTKTPPKREEKKAKRKGGMKRTAKPAKKSASGFGGRGGLSDPKPYIPARVARIQSIQPQPSPSSNALRTLQDRVEQHPLRRDFRRDLLKALARRGDASLALNAATSWVKLDERNAQAQWTHGLWQARAGQATQALNAFGNAIELASTDTNLLRRFALHLKLREHIHLAHAAFQALAAHTGSADDILDLVDIERLILPQNAAKRLAWLRSQPSLRLTSAQTQRADALLKEIGAATRLNRSSGHTQGDLEVAPEKPVRGAVYVSMTWEGDEDLDLSVTLPNGEMISPNAPLSFLAQGRRGRVVGEARNGHRVGSGAKVPREAIVLPWASRGHYLVEVVRNDASTRPLRASVKIRALGKTRSFQVEIPAQERDVRVARVTIEANPWY